MIVAFALAVVCVAAQKIIPVAVGRAGDELKLQFSPEEVFADIGDMIQFQFYPMVCNLAVLLVGVFALTGRDAESLGGAGRFWRALRADIQFDTDRLLLWVSAAAAGYRYGERPPLSGSGLLELTHQASLSSPRSRSTSPVPIRYSSTVRKAGTANRASSASSIRASPHTRKYNCGRFSQLTHSFQHGLAVPHRV